MTAMSAWAPVVQTLAWIIFLSVLLWLGRGQVSGIADAFRARITEGAGFRATGPAGLSVELEAQNKGLTQISPGDSGSKTQSLSLPPWTRRREQLAEDQRGIHIAHTVAPSTKPGQEFDIYVYLVGWGRDRFGNPNDLSDVEVAEFYMGPAWGDRIVAVPGGKRKVGFRTAAHAPALCLCRLVFKDGHEAILNRYLDFEMGEAISRET